MAAQTTNLFLLEDLEDSSKTRGLADSDLSALRAIADWIKTFVVKPHMDLGRAAPSVPSCLGHWNARSFGWLLSRSPTGAGQTLSSSFAATRDCCWRLKPLAETMLTTR
jgi:hypothetical protein